MKIVLLNDFTMVLYEDIRMTGRANRGCMYEIISNSAGVRDFENWLNNTQ